jgi:hypothetical protein
LTRIEVKWERVLSESTLLTVSTEIQSNVSPPIITMFFISAIQISYFIITFSLAWLVQAMPCILECLHHPSNWKLSPISEKKISQVVPKLFLHALTVQHHMVQHLEIENGSTMQHSAPHRMKTTSLPVESCQPIFCNCSLVTHD